MRALTVALAIALAGARLLSMDDTPGVARSSTTPSAPQQNRQPSDRRVFRTALTRVEVSALVLDKNSNPVRGLIAEDFQILENGLPQTRGSADARPTSHTPASVD